MKGSWRDVQSPGVMIGIAVAFTAAATGAFYAAWAENRLSRATEQTTCTVLQTRVHVATDSENSTTGYYPEITIVHEVEGKRHERVDRGPREISESDARAAGNKFKIGGRYDCAYLPGEPESVILFPRPKSAGWPMAMFGGMLLSLIAVLYVIERRKFAKHGKAKATPKNKVHPAVIVGAVGVGAAIFGVFLYLEHQKSAAVPENPSIEGPSAGLIAVCAPAPGQPIVILDKLAAKNRTDHRMLLVDPATGEIAKRVALGPLPMSCLGADGRIVWLSEQGSGIQARSVDTGEVVKTQADLESALSIEIASAQFDHVTRRLVITTTAKAMFFVDDDFKSEPVTAGTAISRPSAGMDLPIGRLVVRDLHPTYKTPEGTFRTDGHPERKILKDDQPIGDSLWLRPQFVLDVETRSLVWPDPPSLIVCEPTADGDPNKRIKVTRLTLEGKVLWSYTPADESQGNPHECNWYGAGTRAHLAYFTKANGVVGVDAKTGKELYRLAL
jgi:hypothetical protein